MQHWGGRITAMRLVQYWSHGLFNKLTDLSFNDLFKKSGAMNMRKEGVQIGSRDFWFKIVDFLQQNQALIDSDMAPAPSPWKGPQGRDWP